MNPVSLALHFAGLSPAAIYWVKIWVKRRECGGSSSSEVHLAKSRRHSCCCRYRRLVHQSAKPATLASQPLTPDNRQKLKGMIEADTWNSFSVAASCSMLARRDFIASNSYANTSACPLASLPLVQLPLSYCRTTGAADCFEVQGNSFGSWNAVIFLFLPLSFLMHCFFCVHRK